MKIVKWAAVAVTALFALMNLGAALGADQDTWVRVVSGVLAAAGLAATVGLATGRSWGRAAVVVVGVANVAGAVAALVADQDGAPIGLVVGALGVLLGAFADRRSRPAGVPA